MVTLIQVVSMVHYTIDLTLTGECVDRCGMRVVHTGNVFPWRLIPPSQHGAHAYGSHFG